MSQTSGVSCCTKKRQVFDPHVTHLKELAQVDFELYSIEKLKKITG